MKKNILYSALLTLSFLGCGGNEEGTLAEGPLEKNAETIAGYTIFSPTTGDIPYPNNILLAPNSSTTNDYDFGSTLNIPYEPEDTDANIKRQLNKLTGFSTISPISISITANIDLTTITQDTVQLYKVNINPLTGAVVSIDSALAFGIDYVATQSGDKLVILPLKPLDALSNYMPVLTNKLKDTADRFLSYDFVTSLLLSSNPIEENSMFDADTAASLEQVRQGTQAMLAALNAYGKDASTTVAIWNFRTQAIGAVQASIASIPAQATLALGSTGSTTKDLVPTLNGIANIYAGTLSNLPQFMPQASTQNPTNAFEGEFTYSATFTPSISSDINISAFATVPNATSGCSEPAAGWPVVIYQHGITRSRMDLVAYADTFASQCFASIAIDLPLHGETNTNSPFYTSIERTFDIDVVTEVDGIITAAVPDGIIDSSGAHYINLTNVTTTRDNLQQSTSDLLQLEASLGTALGINFDVTKIHFLAHSLGAIAATGYLNTSASVNTITLAMPGQGIAELLNNSADFGPIIEAGLAQKGIIKGTSAYASFMLATQTILDDADPANYALSIGTRHMGKILAFEVVGDGTAENLSDQVIPNRVATAPLSGTEPFLALIQAQKINTQTNPYFPGNTNTATRLVVGAHSSPLVPDASLAATTEIHTEFLSFIASDAALINLADSTTILP
ncbi:hypothetical protein JHD50_12740 [Sulfurimonas sp. MAG313]|nr:hypothetical protein [Sulfurimonas sp. MAG313]MDF1882154.1 hypothetical protein [Sulfurimonas sp. MAG313]